MDFVAIDFETATGIRSSACEIGLAFVKDGRVADTRSWLIRPPGNVFDNWNIQRHGIKPEDVEYEREFDELWPSLIPLIEGQLLVAHNANYHFDVLMSCVEEFRFEYPRVDYVCTLTMGRILWPNAQDHKLRTLCQLHGIPLARQRASGCSRATAELALRSFHSTNLEGSDELQGRLGVVPGKITPSGIHTSCDPVSAESIRVYSSALQAIESEAIAAANTNPYWIHVSDEPREEIVIGITFGHSTSERYEAAVELMEASDQYDVSGTEKNVFHSASFSIVDRQQAEAIWHIVKNWKSSSLSVMGKKASVQDLRSGLVGCCAARLDDPDNVLHCYHAMTHGLGPFGCSRLKMRTEGANSSWLAYGSRSPDGAWVFDKERILDDLIPKIKENRACPFFDEKKVLDTLNRLPPVMDREVYTEWDQGEIHSYTKGVSELTSKPMLPSLSAAFSLIDPGDRPAVMSGMRRSYQPYARSTEPVEYAVIDISGEKPVTRIEKRARAVTTLKKQEERKKQENLAPTGCATLLLVAIMTLTFVACW